MKAARTEQDYPIIVGGDFNVILDPDLDGRGGNNRKKDSARLVEDMHLFLLRFLNFLSPLPKKVQSSH